MLHRVGGEQDRLALARELSDEGLELALVHRIEPAERLVQDDEFGIVGYGRQQLDLLRHAFRQALDPHLREIAQAEIGEQHAGARECGAAAHAFQSRDIGNRRVGPHSLVEAALFREIADAVAHLRDVAPEHADGAFVGREDAEHHAQRRGLAGAIGAEEAQDRTLRQAERQIAHGGEIAEAFGDMGEFDDGEHTRVRAAA